MKNEYKFDVRLGSAKENDPGVLMSFRGSFEGAFDLVENVGKDLSDAANTIATFLKEVKNAEL